MSQYPTVYNHNNGDDKDLGIDLGLDDDEGQDLSQLDDADSEEDKPQKAVEVAAK